MLFRWCSGSIPAMEQQQSFRITSPALKHWWIKWKILPRAHDDFLAPQAEAHRQQHTPPKARLCCCVQTETQAFSTAEISLLRDFQDRLENGMRLRFLRLLHVFSLFLLFHILHVALTWCFTLPVGHMQESSLMSACHGLQASFSHTSGHQTKKAFAYPVRGWKTSTLQGTALNTW